MNDAMAHAAEHLITEIQDQPKADYAQKAIREYLDGTPHGKPALEHRLAKHTPYAVAYPQMQWADRISTLDDLRTAAVREAVEKGFTAHVMIYDGSLHSLKDYVEQMEPEAITAFWVREDGGFRRMDGETALHLMAAQMEARFDATLEKLVLHRELSDEDLRLAQAYLWCRFYRWQLGVQNDHRLSHRLAKVERDAHFLMESAEAHGWIPEGARDELVADAKQQARHTEGAGWVQLKVTVFRNMLDQGVPTRPTTRISVATKTTELMEAHTTTYHGYRDIVGDFDMEARISQPGWVIAQQDQVSGYRQRVKQEHQRLAFLAKCHTHPVAPVPTPEAVQAGTLQPAPLEFCGEPLGIHPSHDELPW